VMITANVVAVLLFGLPLSVTTTVIEFVLVPAGPAVSQLKVPLVGLITASGGELVRLNVSTCAGTSVSVAAKFNVSNLPFSIVRSVPALNSGGVFVARERGLVGSEP